VHSRIGAKGHQHKATFFRPTRDLPIMVSVIAAAEEDLRPLRCQRNVRRCPIVISDRRVCGRYAVPKRRRQPMQTRLPS